MGDDWCFSAGDNPVSIIAPDIKPSVHDAKLIEAATDLLYALKHILPDYENSPLYDNSNPVQKLRNRNIILAEAAIKKATP